MSMLETQITLAKTHRTDVYLLLSVQCVVANVTCVPRLLIVDYPLCFVERLFTTVC
jgi:hypothetical protein